MERIDLFAVSGIRPVTERIVVVDDEIDLANLLAHNLREAGFDVSVATTGAEAIELAERVAPSVILLDLMLPDMTGMEVCQRLRRDPSLGDVGVMMLTAKDDEHDRVLGYEAGTDDYVAKPFEVEEVVTRVRALSRCANERRRSRALKQSEGRFRWRGLEIDPGAQRAYAHGADLPLTPLEIRLLLLFFENPECVFTRNRLLKTLWGLSDCVSTRTVDKQVRRLRERLGEHGGIIETAHGLGYKLRDAG